MGVMGSKLTRAMRTFIDTRFTGRKLKKGDLRTRVKKNLEESYDPSPDNADH